jgi:hypothetical protein
MFYNAGVLLLRGKMHGSAAVEQVLVMSNVFIFKNPNSSLLAAPYNQKKTCDQKVREELH